MLALIPLLASVAPDLIRWIAGDTAGKVAAQVTAAVQQVAGGDDPASVAAALNDDGKLSELRLALARIAADAEAAARKADLDDLAARLADVAGARSQTIALAQAGSPIAWGAVGCSLVVLCGFAAVVVLVLVRPLPPGQETLANMLLGTLAAMAGAAVNYWLGSSAGSARKDAAMARR
jgi:hypothetical protein